MSYLPPLPRQFWVGERGRRLTARSITRQRHKAILQSPRRHKRLNGNAENYDTIASIYNDGEVKCMHTIKASDRSWSAFDFAINVVHFGCGSIFSRMRCGTNRVVTVIVLSTHDHCNDSWGYSTVLIML